LAISNSLWDGDSYTDPYETIDALTELLRYPFLRKEELGQSLARYNGAVRVDITKIKQSRAVRSPEKFLRVVQQFAQEASTLPSYGLEIKVGNRKDYIHFTLELNDKNAVGIFFFDSKRMLSVPQIHNVERLVKQAGLTGAIVVANKIGIPAKQEAARINSEHGNYGIINLEHYDSVMKRNESSN
jgi:hypothetical protein